MTFVILPAVDVADGAAVRLVQGAAGTETSYGDPLQAALAWARDGAEWIHLVDLDAAFGRGNNRELLAEVVRRVGVAVELSGGIRDESSLAAALATGAARVNLGTAALESPEWVRSAIARHGRADRGRPGCPGSDARRPRLDEGRRRSLGDSGSPRRRRMPAIRRHGRAPRRHPDRAEPRLAPRRLRGDPGRGRGERWGVLALRPARAAGLGHGRGRHRREGALCRGVHLARSFSCRDLMQHNRPPGVSIRHAGRRGRHHAGAG